MNIETQQRGAVTVIRPGGPIAGTDADLCKTRFRDEIVRNLGRVVLDASRIPYVDSKGLEILVDLTRELAQSGKALKLCAANETLRQTLEVTGVSAEFEHFADAVAAVRSYL